MRHAFRKLYDGTGYDFGSRTYDISWSFRRKDRADHFAKRLRAVRACAKVRQYAVAV